MIPKTVLFAAGLIAAGASAQAQEVTLRFQHFVSPASGSPMYFMEPWVEKIEAESNGRIKIELFPMMQLGGRAQDQYDLIRDGAIDGGWIVPGYQPGRFPEVEALELPFMTPKSGELASVAAWEFTQKHLMDDFADIHVIATHMHGEGIVHKRGPALTVAEDFRGLNLRAPTRPATLLLDKLGATPVGMPVPAFPEALAKGVLDGGVITIEMAPSLKLDELTDSHTDMAGDRSLYNLYFVWAMNKAKYDALPDDLRAIIDANSGAATSALAGRAYDLGDEDGFAVLVDSGNDIAVLGPEETARVRALGDEVTAEWVAEITAKGYDGAGLVADARAAVDAAMAGAGDTDIQGAAAAVAGD